MCWCLVEELPIPTTCSNNFPRLDRLWELTVLPWWFSERAVSLAWLMPRATACRLRYEVNDRGKAIGKEAALAFALAVVDPFWERTMFETGGERAEMRRDTTEPMKGV